MGKSLEDKINDNHIIFITSEMNSKQISDAILSILAWSEMDEKLEINLYLTGECHYLLNYMALYDVLSSVNNPVNVFCFGVISAYGSIFLALPNKGKRYALRHGSIEFQQPYGAMNYGVNQETEIAIEAEKVSEERRLFEEILSKGINKPLETIHHNVEIEREFTAEEALEYGLIDEILE